MVNCCTTPWGWWLVICDCHAHASWLITTWSLQNARVADPFGKGWVQVMNLFLKYHSLPNLMSPWLSSFFSVGRRVEKDRNADWILRIIHGRSWFSDFLLMDKYHGQYPWRYEGYVRIWGISNRSNSITFLLRNCFIGRELQLDVHC